MNGGRIETTGLFRRDIFQSSPDPNSFTAKFIGGHNVIIAVGDETFAVSQ